MKTFTLGMIVGLTILIAVLLFTLYGCALTPSQAAGMTPEQIQAWASTQEDVYACFGINGPPPNGSGFLIVVPKGSSPQISLSPSCQVLSGTLGQNSVSKQVILPNQ